MSLKTTLVDAVIIGLTLVIIAVLYWWAAITVRPSDTIDSAMKPQPPRYCDCMENCYHTAFKCKVSNCITQAVK
jgi:hypothetical protein